MDEQEITPCNVWSRNIEHHIADNFTALDNVVCFGNALQRKAPGDGVDKPTLLQQISQLRDPRRPIFSRRYGIETSTEYHCETRAAEVILALLVAHKRDLIVLLAEIHGRYVQEALSFEDYLTSTVFGHLRYVPPGRFWEAFLCKAVSLQVDGDSEISAFEHLQHVTGTPVSAYKSLEVLFWPTHPQGEPDVVLLLQGQPARPVAVFIEAKLGAGKSGTGEDDQLARYLRIGDTLPDLKPRIPEHAAHVLVFLTTGDSRAEMVETLQQYGDTRQARLRLYRLQWQDILEVAAEYKAVGDPITRLVLNDVSSFLRSRGLEHFRGMRIPSELLDFSASDGLLFASAPLLRDVVVPANVDLIRGEWAHEH